MFGFFGAGPDPRTMTCEKINRGMEVNAYAAKYRSGAQHKANAQARVAELEPFYQACKAGLDPASVLPAGTGATGDLSLVLPGTTPTGALVGGGGGGGGGGTGGAGGGGGGGGGSGAWAIDWKKVALVASMGVIGIVFVAILRGKKKGPAK